MQEQHNNINGDDAIKYHLRGLFWLIEKVVGYSFLSKIPQK